MVHFRLSILRFFILTFCFLSACQEDSIRDSAVPAREIAFWDEAARYLAGLPVTKDSSFFPATQDAGYALHVALMNTFWKKVSQTEIARMKEFQQKYLSKTPDTVIYPLSGADFGNLFHLFPNCKKYVMIATEHPGQFLHPDNFTPQQRTLSLNAIRIVISSIAQYNYLYSAYMRRYMNGHYVYRGTMPVVLIMMARMGHRPLSVEEVFIDEKGKLERGMAGAVQGYRIRFEAEGKLRELVYLPIRLSNDAVDPASATGKFLWSHPDSALMLKAAIYLAHWPAYSQVRDYFLKTSDLIVTDDSGIPYRDLNQKFDVELFGAYRRPVLIGGVGYHPQPDLVQAYSQKSIPIYFHYGYGARLSTAFSNLQLARKK